MTTPQGYPDLTGEIVYAVIEALGGTTPTEVNREEAEHQGEMSTVIDGHIMFMPSMKKDDSPVPGDFLEDFCQYHPDLTPERFLVAAQQVVKDLGLSDGDKDIAEFAELGTGTEHQPQPWVRRAETEEDLDEDEERQSRPT